jgi:hypothetical protein
MLVGVIEDVTNQHFMSNKVTFLVRDPSILVVHPGHVSLRLHLDVWNRTMPYLSIDMFIREANRVVPQHSGQQGQVDSSRPVSGVKGNVRYDYSVKAI